MFIEEATQEQCPREQPDCTKLSSPIGSIEHLDNQEATIRETLHK